MTGSYHMRALLYTRQSVSEDAETLSLESQSTALSQWATAQGWVVVGEVRDHDAKGWDDSRPGLAEIMRKARAREFDVLVFWRFDRLARSVRIQENVLHELGELGVEVRSMTEAWVADPMFRQILGAVAEQDTRTIKANVRRALGERTRRGLPHGVAPFGYVRDVETGRLIVVEAQAELVRDLFGRYADGAGFTELARWLNGQGMPTVTGRSYWHATTVRHLLGNPVYAGVIRSGGIEVQGAHQGIIAPDVWELVEARRSRRRYVKPKPFTSWMEGSIRHGCGAPMFLRSPKRPHQRWYFQCYVPYQFRPVGFTPAHTCHIRPAAIGAERVERASWALILAALRQPVTVERVVKDAERDDRRHGSRVRDERAGLLEQRRRVRHGRELAEGLYLAGQRDRAWFDAQDARIGGELDGIERVLAMLPAAIDVAALTIQHAALVELAGYVGGMPLVDRGRVLRELGVVVIEAGSRVTIRWAPEVARFLPARYR